MLWCQNLRAIGLYFAVADAHLVHAIHKLRAQIEIETGASARRDLAFWSKNHARIFKRVVKIVAGHDGGKLWCPLLFSKRTADNKGCVRRVGCAREKPATNTYFFACCCSPAVCCCCCG